MDELIDKVKNHYSFDSNEFVLLDKNKYEIFDIDFKEINNSNLKKLFFIDGGQQEIIGSNSFSFGKIRSVCVWFEDKKKFLIDNYDVLVLLKNEQDKLVYEITIKGSVNFDFKINAYDKSLNSDGSRVKPDILISLTRKLTEIILAKKISDNNKECVIVMDGILLEENPIISKYYDALFGSCKSNNNILCGVAKNSNLVTNNARPLDAYLFDKKKEVWYSKIASPKSERHKVNIFMAKLHENSKHVFRVEIVKGHGVDEVFSGLKFFSKDPVFLGYPYGLVVVDELARVSNEEAERLKFGLFQKLGISGNKIIENSHSILDNLRF